MKSDNIFGPEIYFILEIYFFTSNLENVIISYNYSSQVQSQW